MTDSRNRFGGRLKGALHRLAAAALASAVPVAVLGGCVSCQANPPEVPDAGQADAGNPDAGKFDLRFKGLGTPFNPSRPLESMIAGTPPAGPEYTFVGVGPAFGYGVTQAHTIVYLRFRPQVPIIFDSKLGGDALNCPDSLQNLFDEGRLVLGLGGDVTKRGTPGLIPSDARCSVLGVKFSQTPVLYDQFKVIVPTISEVEPSLAADERSRSRVVTAITAVDGGVLYVAAGLGPGPDGGFESFDTSAAAVTSAAIAGQAASWADAGYVITASGWNGIDDHVLLVATRPHGSQARLETRVYQGYGDPTVQFNEMLDAGFAPAAAVATEFRPPDGGFEGVVTYVGQRYIGQ